MTGTVINWFPGHMYKATKELAELLPQVDLVIELLDCRLPFSSGNPAIRKLAANVPGIKILSKSDLADAAITPAWQEYLESQGVNKTLCTTLDHSNLAGQIVSLCYQLVPGRPRNGSRIQALVTGIPNVGKSTLINTVCGKKITRTGNEPAITKGMQKVRVDDGLQFIDTPGILWPKIENQHSAYRLAVSGAIKDTATEVEDLAFYLSAFLIDSYPQLLCERYELAAVPGSDIEFLELMGARRGCLRSGGRVDLEKASAILVNEFRAGKLGRITLETPALIAEEERLLALKLQERAARKKNQKGQGKDN